MYNVSGSERELSLLGDRQALTSLSNGNNPGDFLGRQVSIPGTLSYVFTLDSSLIALRPPSEAKPAAPEVGSWGTKILTSLVKRQSFQYRINP